MAVHASLTIDLKEKFLALHLDSHNHVGIKKTRQPIARDYWPGLSLDVDNYRELRQEMYILCRNEASTQLLACFRPSMPIPQNRFTGIRGPPHQNPKAMV